MVMDMDINENQQQEVKNNIEENVEIIEKSKEYSKKAIVLGLLPFAIYLFCLIVSGGNTSSNGRGIVFILFGFYCVILGIPVAIISFETSIKAIKLNKNALSTTALVISCIPILIIIYFLSLYFFWYI